MRRRCKVSGKNIFRLLAGVLLLFITFHINARGKQHTHLLKSLTDINDTIPAKDSSLKIIADTLNDSGKVSNDSLHKKQKVDSMYISKDSINSPIDYAADDSGVLIIPKKQFYLYGKANTANKDIKLEAQNIMYDQATQLVTAYGGIDTGSNPLLNKPKITQEGSTSLSDTIKFNLKTQRGISKNTYYNEG